MSHSASRLISEAALPFLFFPVTMVLWLQQHRGLVGSMELVLFVFQALASSASSVRHRGTLEKAHGPTTMYVVVGLDLYLLISSISTLSKVTVRLLATVLQPRDLVYQEINSVKNGTRALTSVKGRQ